MAISMECPGCERTLQTTDELAGKRIRCPGCGQVMVASAARPTSGPTPMPPRDNHSPSNDRKRP
jgi:uncharacterized Zn finger protein